MNGSADQLPEIPISPFARRDCSQGSSNQIVVRLAVQIAI
jgi:hypothetical protein